jgi:hypothetical protein
VFTFDEARGYLAGMIDGEGTVTAIASAKTPRRIRVCNTDASILTAAQEACDVLGLTTTTQWHLRLKRPHHLPLAQISITGKENLQRVADIVPIRSATKIERLKLLIEAWDASRWPMTRLGVRVTHCKNGHALDEANTLLLKHGRRCRTCELAYQREYKRRRRAASSL